MKTLNVLNYFNEYIRKKYENISNSVIKFMLLCGSDFLENLTSININNAATNFIQPNQVQFCCYFIIPLFLLNYW